MVDSLPTISGGSGDSPEIEPTISGGTGDSPEMEPTISGGTGVSPDAEGFASTESAGALAPLQI